MRSFSTLNETRPVDVSLCVPIISNENTNRREVITSHCFKNIRVDREKTRMIKEGGESHASTPLAKNRKIQFVKINRLVHKLTNSDELADKGLH